MAVAGTIVGLTIFGIGHDVGAASVAPETSIAPLPNESGEEVNDGVVPDTGSETGTLSVEEQRLADVLNPSGQADPSAIPGFITNRNLNQLQ